MTNSFSTLAAEYGSLLRAMRITADQGALTARCRVILDRASRQDYARVIASTGVPKLFAMASFERESSSDYATSPAQGDRWDRVSVHVPRGLGPYVDWAAAAIAAYRIDHLDAVGARNWIWARACYEGELFNGFGPRNHGRRTGYLWAGTNIYTGGKYVADGVWDPNAHDTQLGMIPLMVTLLRLDPSLALADPLPSSTSPPIIIAPLPASPETGGSLRDVSWIQTKLNTLGADPPLVVDGNFGRLTRRAVVAFQRTHGLDPDGMVGPLTMAGFAKALPPTKTAAKHATAGTIAVAGGAAAAAAHSAGWSDYAVALLIVAGIIAAVSVWLYLHEKGT